jgi:hypothetical protein
VRQCCRGITTLWRGKSETIEEGAVFKYSDLQKWCAGA